METVTRFIVALKSIDASQNKCLSSLTLGRTNPSISLGWAETQFTCLGYLLSKSHAPNIDRALRVRAYLIRCKFTVTHDIHSQQSNVCDGPNDVDSPKHRTAKSNYGQIEYELGFVAARPMHCVFHLKLFVFFSVDSHEMANFSFDWTVSTRCRFNLRVIQRQKRRKIEFLFMRNRFMSEFTWRSHILTPPLDTLHTLASNRGTWNNGKKYGIYEMGPLERALAMTKAAYNL